MTLNGRVLLLNHTYEPLGTVSVARAITMTFKEKPSPLRPEGTLRMDRDSKRYSLEQVHSRSSPDKICSVAEADKWATG